MSPVFTIIFIVFAIIAILFSLVVHEFGHFLFAKVFQVNVKEFSIGVGPKIFTKKYKKTNFSLRSIPIMAYVLISSKKLVSLYEDLVKEQIEEIENFKTKNVMLIQQNDKKTMKKLASLEKELKKYQNMAKIEPNTIFVDDIAKWKQLIIFFGGVLFNIIFCFFFWIITAFGLTSIIETVNAQYNVIIDTNPFNQLNAVFTNLGKNMVFYNAWKPSGASSSVGTIVGDGINFNKLNPTSEYLIYSIFNYFTVYNLILFIFNLIPFPPLDGFKILNTLLSYNKKMIISKNVENILTYVGVGLILYIFLTGIIADLIR